MPPSTIDPQPSTTIPNRMLSAEEQLDIHVILRNQRRLEDQLKATGLTPAQEKIVFALFLQRQLLRGLLNFPEEVLLTAKATNHRAPTERQIIARHRQAPNPTRTDLL